LGRAYGAARRGYSLFLRNLDFLNECSERPRAISGGYLANLKTLGQVYREIFGMHYPAMALVQVVRLVEKPARVEIEAMAVVPR
jgi:enamine deaminase RidA (YjgF/YER057c/UK114 family)